MPSHSTAWWQATASWRVSSVCLVTVKSKYQVVIPAVVRRQVRIGVGDLLEAIDRRLAEALDDLKAGRMQGHRKPRCSQVYTVVYRAAWAVGRTSGISPRPRQV